MSYVDEKSVQKEYAACEVIMPTLRNLLAWYTQKEQIELTHNTDKKNKQGSDITAKINGRDIEIDAKGYKPIRDWNYTTLFSEVCQWEKGNKTEYHWDKGCMYSDLGDYIAGIVPLDDGYDMLDMQNYALFVADKHRQREIVDSVYPSYQDAINEANEISRQVKEGTRRLSDKNSCQCGKIGDVYKLMTYRSRTWPDNYNLIIPIVDSYVCGVIRFRGTERYYLSYLDWDADRRKLTEFLFKSIKKRT